MSVMLSRVTVNGRLLLSCLENCSLCFIFFFCLFAHRVTHKNTPLVIVNTYFINEYTFKISYLLEPCLRVVKGDEYTVKKQPTKLMWRSFRWQFVVPKETIRWHFSFFFLNIYLLLFASILFYSYTRQLQETDRQQLCFKTVLKRALKCIIICVFVKKRNFKSVKRGEQQQQQIKKKN